MLDCCFKASQFSYSIFHNLSLCCGLANPLAPLHLWQLCYCLYCCRKERCFTSFLGCYCRLIHAECCSCRLQPWWLTTHPGSSRHQHAWCICSAGPQAQLGAWGSSGLGRLEWHFHGDFQHSFFPSAAAKQQITTNAFFKRRVFCISTNSSSRTAALCSPQIHVLTAPEIPKPV